MKRVLLAGPLSVTAGLWALTLPLSVPVAAQAPQAAATSAVSNFTPPKTPWGHPDLQGVWTTDLEIGVPLERPVDLGEKATLTEDEFQKRAVALKKKYTDDK